MSEEQYADQLESLLLAAERAKVKSLSEVIESQKQTHGALIKKCRELEDQNAAMREALEKIATTAFQQYDGSKPFVSEHDSGYSLGIADGHRLAAKWAHEAIEAARAVGVDGV